MSLLETVFRESSPKVLTAQREDVKTLYLKNQSLDNRKVHIITDAESHIKLPPTVVNEEGIFTIDLSILENSITIQVGDVISLLVKDIVSNISTSTSVTIS